jgi:hypothetical protein
MPSEFAQLIVDIEAEASADGRRAMREMEQLREEFRVASAQVGAVNRHTETRNAITAPE